MINNYNNGWEALLTDNFDSRPGSLWDYAVMPITLMSRIFFQAIDSEPVAPVEDFLGDLEAWATDEKKMNWNAQTETAVARIQACRRNRSNYLDLSNLNLKSLPNVIGSLDRLEVIKLHSNKLTSLPDTFRNLQGLKELELNRNEIAILPNWIGSLGRLRTLCLSFNPLINLPNSIMSLPANCRVWMNGLSLPEGITQQIQAQVNSHNGPRFEFDMPVTSSPEQYVPTESAVARITVCQNSSIGNPKKDSFVKDLKAWALREKASNPDANTEKAVKKIIAYREKNKSKLNLSNLNLQSLPKAIGSLKSLQNLDLGSNNLSWLPKSMGNLKSLKVLYLDSNKLQSVPNCIRSLESLEGLYLNFNKLKSVPKWMESLKRLEGLYLNFNKLKSVPKSMGNLKSLKILCLDSNKLRSVPNCIRSLEHLQILYLGSNNLEDVPGWIGSLQGLRVLHLNSNPLTGLPNSILSLPSDCTVEISGSRLTGRIMQRLREQVNRQGYVGPQFGLDMALYNASRPTNPLEKLCKNLTQHAEQSLPENFAEEHKGNNALQLFLNKISDTHDFMRGSAEMKKALAQKLVAYLNLMHVNKDYAQAFQSIIEGEANKCGDRIALAIIRLGIAKQLIEYDLHDLAKLADFLKRGVWTVGSCVPDQYVMGLLENTAAKKIATLRFVDDVEVYLAYFVKLKELLNLPLDISEMLFASGVTEEDLSIAASQVTDDWNNKDKFYKFLITQPKWEEALKARYPDDVEQLNERRYAALENALAAETIWKKGLLKLTKKALEIENCG